MCKPPPTKALDHYLGSIYFVHKNIESLLQGHMFRVNEAKGFVRFAGAKRGTDHPTTIRCCKILRALEILSLTRRPTILTTQLASFRQRTSRIRINWKKVSQSLTFAKDGCPQIRRRAPEEEAVGCAALPSPCSLLGGTRYMRIDVTR